MSKKKNPITAITEFFATNNQDVCELTFQIVKDQMKARFAVAPVKKTVVKKANKAKVELPTTGSFLGNASTSTAL